MKITIKVGLSLEAGWLGVACWGLSLSIFSSLIPFGAGLIMHRTKVATLRQSPFEDHWPVKSSLVKLVGCTLHTQIQNS